MPTTRTILRSFIVSALLSTAAGTAFAQRAEEPVPPPIDRFTSGTLARFSSEAEFESYVAAVRAAQERRQERFGSRRSAIRFAQAQAPAEVQNDTPEEPVCTDPELCPVAEEQNDAMISVTGSRISTATNPSNPAITNNQMSGVDEGDIVKQIGQYLIVLQDGRLFVIDTRPANGAGLALVDRADVYRSSREYAWYDEMLVQGDRIVVTAYSYREGASEVSVFRLGDGGGGQVSREGVFLISSNDYYSSTNYATRLVGDSLVVYTPYAINSYSGFEGGRFRWPTVRRWLPESERREAVSEGARLFDAPRVHRPVRDTIYPEVHTISVCPLGPVGSGRDLSCRTTAFVGPAIGQLYVTNDHAYLWTTPPGSELRTSRRLQRCGPDQEDSLAATAPATVFRVAIADGGLEVAGAQGVPIDQFSFQANESNLYGLLRHSPVRCRPDDDEVRLAFMTMPLDRFGNRIRDLAADSYVDMPPTRTPAIANRFTDTHLVYGSLTGDRWNPRYDEDGRFERPPAFALPVASPRSVRQVDVPHSVLRAERAGDDIVLTGYRDGTGLRISLVDLAGRPRVASTAHLPKRYESEGRSHAFNSLMESDGSGIMGLPTVYYDNNRPVWRSEASDLSYFSADAGGRLTSIGALSGENRGRDPNYRCEVSCIDWYGNSRPIFTDGRVFALSGTELVEGRIANGRIEEIRRLDMTRPPPRREAGPRAP
jgi:hypothetical protein